MEEVNWFHKHFMELFEREGEFMVKEGYHNDSQKEAQRKKAEKIFNSKTKGYEGYVRYLAMIYFDQYLSNDQVLLTRHSLADDVDVLATCCLAIALKMWNNAFDETNFLMEQKLDYNLDDIVKILKLVDRWLDTHKCKHPVTAVRFLDFFTGEMKDLEVDQRIGLKDSARGKIYDLQWDIKFTQFKPSIVAAAALADSCRLKYSDRLEYCIKILGDWESFDQVNLKRAIDLVPPDTSLNTQEEKSEMPYNPEDPLPNDKDSSFFELELFYTPLDGYATKVDMAMHRQCAITVIKHYGESYSDLVTSFIAVNYFDNIMCTTLSEELVDNLPLMATCCFTYASKMINPKFSAIDFWNNQKLKLYKEEDIHKLETLINKGLAMRNCERPVTALYYLDFFIRKMRKLSEDLQKFLQMSPSHNLFYKLQCEKNMCPIINEEHLKNLKFLATTELYKLQDDIVYTKFRPSLMAAVALGKSCSMHYNDLEYYWSASVVSCENYDQETYVRLMETVYKTNVASMSSSSSNDVEPNYEPPQNLDRANTEP